jgi:hypothetical protein
LLLTKLTIIGLHSQTGKAGMAQKNAEKTEQLQKKYYEKARKFIVKERIKMQDKNTQKRMAEARKRARKFNRRHNDIFFIRFIKKRKIKQ